MCTVAWSSGEVGGDWVESDTTPHADVTRLSANAVAALYAGTPTASLVTAGLLTGGSPAHRALLDSAFSGRPAYLLDYF